MRAETHERAEQASSHFSILGWAHAAREVFWAHNSYLIGS